MTNISSTRRSLSRAPRIGNPRFEGLDCAASFFPGKGLAVCGLNFHRLSETLPLEFFGMMFKLDKLEVVLGGS